MKVARNIKLTIVFVYDLLSNYDAETKRLGAVLILLRVNKLNVLRVNLLIDINLKILLQIYQEILRYNYLIITEAKLDAFIEMVKADLDQNILEA